VIVVVASLLAAAPQVTFNDAVQRALEHHPSMRISDSDTARAMAILEQQRSTSLPTLYLNGSYTRLDADRTLSSPQSSLNTVDAAGNVIGHTITPASSRILAAKDAISANATLTVPLTPRNWVQWYRGDYNADASKATAFDVRRQVALSVGRAYLAALGAKRVVEASEHARDTGQAHLDYSSQRAQGGVGTRIDVARAEQELQSSLAQLESALGALAKAQEDLGVATGTDGPLEAVEEPSLGAPDAVDSALQDAEGKRTDVLAAKSRQKAAEVSDNGKWSDYTPLLSAVFQPFYQNPPSLTTPETGWQAQLVLTLPLYDGGLRYGQQKERHALSTTANAQLDALLQQAHDEVRSGFELVKHSDLALTASQKSAKAAHEALDLATVAYKAGATTNLEVIDAERRARDADLAVAQAEDAARRARLELLAASGRFP
jgi:outer membrane protein TolC